MYSNVMSADDDIPEDERVITSSVSSHSAEDEDQDDALAEKKKRNRSRPWQKPNHYENVQTEDVNVVGVTATPATAPSSSTAKEYDDDVISSKWKQRLTEDEEKEARTKALELKKKLIEEEAHPVSSSKDQVPDDPAATEHQRVRMEALKLLNLADSGSSRTNKITSTSSALRGLDFDHKSKQRSWNHSSSSAHAYERVSLKTTPAVGKRNDASGNQDDDDDLSYDGSVHSKKSWSDRYSVDRHLHILNNGRLGAGLKNREMYKSANNMYKTSPHAEDDDNGPGYHAPGKSRLFMTWIYSVKEGISNYVKNARADGYTSGSHRHADHSSGQNGIFTGVAVTNFLDRLTPTSRAKAERRSGAFTYENVNLVGESAGLGVLYRGYRPADAYLDARKKRRRQCIFWGSFLTMALLAISSVAGIASSHGARKSNAAIDIGEEIRFFVTSDIPLSSSEEDRLGRQLDNLSTDYGDFLVHLGDITDAQSSLCAFNEYDDVATLIWDHCNVPVFMIPGNNDWNECPMPEQAFGYWMEKLNRYEEIYADDGYEVPLVGRQSSRDENFAFLSKGVLFIGINLVDGKVQDEYEWEVRHLENVQWIEQQLSENDEGEFRAIVLMGHSGYDSKVGDFFWPAVDRLKEVNKPVLYIHANDGEGMIEYEPVADFPKFRAVRLEKGGLVGPTIVKVLGGDAPFSFVTMDP